MAISMWVMGLRSAAIRTHMKHVLSLPSLSTCRLRVIPRLISHIRKMQHRLPGSQHPFLKHPVLLRLAHHAHSPSHPRASCLEPLFPLWFRSNKQLPAPSPLKVMQRRRGGRWRLRWLSHLPMKYRTTGRWKWVPGWSLAPQVRVVFFMGICCIPVFLLIELRMWWGYRTASLGS